jgi:hypothetical protein
MTRLLRAVDVPATSREDYWRHVVDETLGPLDLQLPADPTSGTSCSSATPARSVSPS